MSVSILEKFVSGVEKRTRRPAMSCIGSISDDGCSVAHNWENAADVDPTEMSCQVVLINPPLATARAASCNGHVHLLICLSPKYKNTIFSKTKQFRAVVSIYDL